MYQPLILLILILCSSLGYCQDDNQCLVGRWVFDREHISGHKVKDLAGNHDATIEGPVELFKENDDRGLILHSETKNAVLISNDISPTDLPQKEISVEAWVYPLGPLHWQGFIGCFEDNGNIDKGLGWMLGFHFYQGFFALSGEGEFKNDDSVTYLLSRHLVFGKQWNHVVGTYDGVWQRIYVNGELSNSAKIQSGEINYNAGSPYVIGTYRDSNENRVFDGVILETRVYNRILSQEEIQSHYETFPKSPPKPKGEVKQPPIYSSSFPGFWRYWTIKDGLSETSTLRTSLGPTGNVTIVHALGTENIDYFDGYKIDQIPSSSQMDFPIVIETPKNHLWSFNKDKPEFIAILDLKKKDTKRQWIKHALSPPMSFTPFGPTFRPINQNRMIYISQDQRIMEYDVTTESSTLIKNVTDTKLGLFLSLSFGNDNRTIWISSQNGLGQLTADRELKEHLSRGKKGPCIFQYETDKNDIVGFILEGIPVGLFYLGTRHFFLFNGKDFLEDQKPDPVSSPKITVVKLPPLTIQQEGQLYTFRHKDDAYTSISYEDNALWVYRDNALARYAPSLWQSPYELKDINTRTPRIVEDQNGTLWVGYVNNYALLHDKKWEIFLDIPDFCIEHRSYIGILPNGKIYGNLYDTIVVYDPSTKQDNLLYYTQGTKRYPYFFRQFDRNKLLLTNGSTLGLYSVDKFEPIIDLEKFPEAPTHPTLPPHFRPSYIKYVEKMNNGEYWIATIDGIRCVSNEELIPMDESIRFPYSPATCILKLKDDSLWVSTSHAIYKFDKNQWKLVRNGLDEVTTMKQVKNESIWVGTHNGLYQYWNGSWVDYTTEDGLPDNLIYDILEDSHGRLWVATAEGLSLHHPESDLDYPDTYVNVKGEYVHQNDKPEKISSEGNVQISFTGIDRWKYTKVERLLYSYRIDKEDWTPYTTNTIATYSGLSAGKHIFQVKAMDRNWNSDPTPATWTFNIILPWYKEPKFIIITSSSLIIILLLLFLHLRRHLNQENIINKRTKDLKQANNELLVYQQQLRSLASQMSIIEERSKRDIAVKIHDRIGHSLAICQMQIEYLQKKDGLNKNAENTMEEIRHLVKQIIEDTRDLTVEISPPILYELGLIQTLKWLIEQLNEKYNMHFEIADSGHKIDVGMDERGILFNSIKELLFNVIKHAQTQYARVSISNFNKNVQVSVKDNGIGFDMEDLKKTIVKKQSFGLFSIQERIEYLGGTFICESQYNTGTHIAITLPLQGERDSL